MNMDKRGMGDTVRIESADKYGWGGGVEDRGG